MGLDLAVCPTLLIWSGEPLVCEEPVEGGAGEFVEGGAGGFVGGGVAGLVVGSSRSPGKVQTRIVKA